MEMMILVSLNTGLGPTSSQAFRKDCVINESQEANIFYQWMEALKGPFSVSRCITENYSTSGFKKLLETSFTSNGRKGITL